MLVDGPGATVPLAVWASFRRNRHGKLGFAGRGQAHRAVQDTLLVGDEKLAVLGVRVLSLVAFVDLAFLHVLDVVAGCRCFCW